MFRDRSNMKIGRFGLFLIRANSVYTLNSRVSVNNDSNRVCLWILGLCVFLFFPCNDLRENTLLFFLLNSGYYLLLPTNMWCI